MAEKEPQQSSVVDPLEGNPPISEVGGQEEVDLGTAKRKKSKKLKQDPRLIVDGLQLSLKASKQPFVSYTYALTTLMESGIKIETKLLASEPVESQHIRLHTLQPGETLSSIASTYRKSYTVAVILINTEDSLELPIEIEDGAVRSKKTTFPIALVSGKDGKSLRDFVTRHETGELSAKLETKNQPHIEYKRQPKGGSSPGSESTVTLSTRRRGLSFRRKNRRLPVINLKEEIKNLIFPVSGPVCVSEDEEKFKLVMTILYQYEQMIQRGGQTSGTLLFNKLMKHIDEMFARDFPFYLLVAYRAHKKQSCYLCDELRPFVRTCVDKFERLEPVSICKTLETFFLKVEDSNLMFESDNSTTSVYLLLEEACIALMNFSFSLRSQEGSASLHKAVYYRMLWIATAYKCRTQRSTGPREKVDYWKNNLTAAENFTQLNTEVIQSLKRGVEFGRLLQLSDETSFTSSYMADVLTTKNIVRPFHQLREFVIVLEPYVLPEEDFVRHLLARPRECYRQAGAGSWRRAQEEQALLLILQDGLGFLDTVLEVSRKRQWTSTPLHTELKEWCMVLLEPVQIIGGNADACLKEFLSHRTGGVTKHYQETIKRDLVLKLEMSLDKLSVEQFLQVYKAFYIWPPWIVQKFLEQYKIPQEVKICSNTWKEFFGVFVERFVDAHHHKFLLEFFQSVAQCYLIQNRSKEFILDLLRLDVPQLFVTAPDEGSICSGDAPIDLLALTVPEEFVQFLSDYIQRNSLRDDLLDDIQTIWRLIDEHSEFQKLVLQVLQQELIPESGSLHGPLSKSMKFLLKNCVSTICSGLDSLHDLSSKLTFCWGVVGSCCLKMPLTENLEWLSIYYSLIDQLGRIYSVYQSKQEDAETKSILTEDSMSTEVTQCTDEGVGVFFKWIAQAQQVLGTWRDRLKSRDVNYDDLVVYSKQYSQISRAAMALNSGGLVMDNHELKMMKQEFLQQFELLNLFLLRYVSGCPDLQWCSMLHILSVYGVNLEPRILLAIKKYVTFPGESPYTRRSNALETPIPSSVSNNFLPPGEIQLEISRELTASALKNLVAAFASFIEPVTDLDFLTFFYLSGSEIFDKHLKLQLRKLDKTIEPSSAPQPSMSSLLSIQSITLDEPAVRAVHITHLARALENTMDFIKRLIVGSASYIEIVAEGSLSLRSLDIEKEFEILALYSDFAKIDTDNAKGLDGVKAMLQLFQYTRHIQVIHSVCQQYNLTNCLNDPDLNSLTELVETLEESRDDLTAKDAIDKMKNVTKALCLETGQSLRFLDLFSAVQDSSDFHRFVVQEKQFVGQQGQELFQQQFELIKTQLQHEEYNEAVLNHLYAAFKLIKPFTNTEQNFSTLMVSVASLNALDARRQLDTVNRNINLIRLWFSRAEGDTLQGVSTELRCILASGYYTFLYSASSTPLNNVCGSMQLHYIPHSSLYQNVGEVGESPSKPTEDRRNHEAIGDFVMKLGFLDSEGEAGSDISHFLHINQTATKLLGLYSKLRELGHPNFLGSPMKTNLRCSLSLDQANEIVSDAAQLLVTWEKEVANLRAEYEQLLYFSVPKLLHLYQGLTAHQPNLTAVVQDVSFLFENKPHVQAQLRNSVKDLLEAQSHLKEDRTRSTPMHVVGAFLKSLLTNLDLSNNSLKRRRRGSVSSTVSRSSSSGQSTHILHSCAAFTQGQLLRLIISIYGGVPEAFEVYHCRPTSTEEELRLFMNPKRATKRPFQYLILEINKLPYRLQEMLVRIHFDLKEAVVLSDEAESPCVHFVETGPSLLQEMPWLLRMDYKGIEPQLDFAEASSTSKNAALHSDDFSYLQLVYGKAGDGKTHYIENQMRQCSECLRVAVNEAFTPLSTIQKLAGMEFDDSEPAVFFNFTLLPPGEAVSENERSHYFQLIESINWFFFDLFILGYVEDPVTGLSFRFPGGFKIAIYVEVPSRVQMDPTASLKAFYEDIPSLSLLGSKYFVESTTPFVVDPDVQLVCKYLRAFKTGGSRGIDRLYKESGGLFGGRKQGVPIKFSLDSDLSEGECRKLLNRYTPENMKANKATQKLFIKYMKRRCAFLDNCPAFNYNSGSTEYLVSANGEKRKNDTKELGSTLMDTMLKEVSDFCDPFIREDWALKPHHQLIYDFKDGGGTIGLMSLHPDQIPKEDVDKFKKMGVRIPSMFDLYSRDCLDSLLSRALDVPLNKKGRLAIVDDCRYVLTLDFALKMLNIHERAQGGVPVIIEGETGVGKTALIEMLSRLWNYSLFNTWNVYKERIMDFIKGKIQELPPSSFKKHSGSMESVLSFADSSSLREDDLMQIAEIPLPGEGEKQFFSVIRDHLMELAGDPILSVLEPRSEDDDGRLTVSQMVASAQFKDNSKDITRLLYKFLNCRVRTLFFKLNVHAALQPSEIIEFFLPIFETAKMLQKAYERFTTQVKVPFITVFVDEVNTSSCLGLFKEVIIDRTLEGEPIPSNIFIVGACNPHRGNSLAAHGSQETWIRGTYYVRQLHPTIRCLMWDYGALGEQQERDYILAKMKLSNQDDTANADLANLTELIVLSQNLMRKYALEQLKDIGLSDAKASEYSRSCVSQRDIQRVFTFYKWLYKMYMNYQPFGTLCDYNVRAVAVALGLVYYLRLNNAYRKKYGEILDHEMAPSQLSFTKTFKEELDWYINHIDLPTGIAKTRALEENLFATIVCTMTHTPLVIVGSPGSSKTLSFNLTLANLKGQESKVPQFRETEIFKALDPQIYQCSRRTTSKEITTVFSRAINRQRTHQTIPLPVYCVVFMDEAGLPEESHESLKVLHYFLDTQEVSFVAISNHVLDAAKTNRAVSLFRPEATREELTTLAKGCLCSTPEMPPPELRKDMTIVADFCIPYLTLMSKPRFARFFGLRDFINFISYLRRKRKDMLDPQLVMEALERNFNGVNNEDFEYICKLFLRAVKSTPNQVMSRNILDILVSTMLDHPEDAGAENEMRYKLIIDSSDDGSLVRLLFSTGVLQRSNTRVYVCSDFPGDAELQKVNTIAAIRHSVTEGHTVVLSQTDSIHESFYDLFNRRFHRIDAASGPRYYANIAIGAHIKPCRVHSDFDCVVVVKQSEVESIPPPFLNRFEKYYLSHELVLEATLCNVPPAMAAVLKAAMQKAGEFVEQISGSTSLYGLQKETLYSLLMSLLPPLKHDYEGQHSPLSGQTQPTDVRERLMQALMRALKENAGFQIPSYSDDEVRADTAEVMEIIMLDSEFSGQVLRLMSMESKTEVTQVIHNAVKDALDLLHYAKTLDVPSTSANACMVISMLTHWLVRYLCKRVMQLMTSEALCMHHRRIPASFIQSYLNHQHHFSLRELLETQSRKLEEQDSCAANKLVCFIRSSSPLHQLPAQYPTPDHQRSSGGDNKSLLRELVFTNTQELVVHKMSSITSFTNVNDLLKSFALSSTQRVLVVIVNMEDTTKELVNHLRIMIEENESKYASGKKLFALLLHFQTCRPTSPCYPVMFLPGWDFNYLEMIGYSPRGGVLDIRDWFRQCYGKSSLPDHSIAPHLSALLHEAIPAISSRVYFREHPESPFNTAMRIPERNRALERLFFDKGVGEVLCQRFNSYWTPSVMVEYLEKAALHAQQHESPNVIDNLQTNFKSLFVDFLVYMVQEMNKGMNIDVLFDPDSTQDTIKLFLDILRVSPIPKLPEITMLRIANDTSAHKESKEILSPPKFPYFAQVSSGIERLVDQTQRDFNQSIDAADDLLSVLQCSEQDRAQTMSSLFKSLIARLSEVSQGDESTPLSVGLKALLSLNSHWVKYVEDFTHQKLLLEFGNSGTSDKVRRAAFGDLENRTPVQRLAVLHVYVYIHKLNLAKLVSILRPLDQFEDAVLTLTSLASPADPTKSLLASVEDGSDLLGCSEALSSFIISTLFKAIAFISMTYFAQGERQLLEKEVEQVKIWFKAYRDVMSMPSLREHLYTSRSPRTEAQHSAMHLLYLMVRCRPLGDVGTYQCGLHTFNGVFNKFFNTRCELQGSAPRLEHLAAAIMEGLPLLPLWDLPQARGILEGLLSHSFSQYRTVYHSQDMEWFLELANGQKKWQATYIMDGIYEFEYSEDLNAVLGEPESPEHLTLSKLAALLPTALFKFYLRRIILTSIKSTEDPIQSVLLFYNKTEAHKLITKVLCSNPELGRSSPYVPTFYQLCDYISPSPSSENKLMQQPLAHLYFLTVMEDLKDSNFGLAGLVKTVHNISKCEHWFEGHECNCCDDQVTDTHSTTGCQLVLLHIEEQALTQVIIKEVARHLDPASPSKTNALFAVLTEVNAILDDKWMGGGNIGGHGLTLAMHLLREKKSFHKFIACLTTDFNTLNDGINCLLPFHQALATPAPVSIKPDSQTFMPYPELGSEFTSLYGRIVGGMNAVHSSHGSSAKSREKEFIRLADECIHGELGVLTPSGGQAAMNKQAAFRTALWLVTYNEFFIKKRQSKSLVQVISNLSKKVGSTFVQLIQAFLDPELINRGGDGLGESMRSSHLSPLMGLFTGASQENSSMADLQRALVHLITASLAAPPNTTNLWCLLFNPDHLTGSYLPGFMYDSPVGPDDQFYGYGVELSNEGFYSCMDSIQHVTRGTYSLHSLYSLLWVNFSSLFVSLLTQPGSKERLSGQLFSSGDTIVELCSAQMMRLWDLLCSGVNVSEEERSLLVGDCLNRFIEQQLIRTPDLRGRLASPTERDLYEKNWHTKVFTPSLNSVKTRFEKSSAFLTIPLIQNVIKLDSRYPWAPGVPSLTDVVLSSNTTADSAHPLYPLSQFVIEYPRLRVGMDLLPSLLELYQWLHSELCYAMSYEQTTNITLGRLSKVLTRHSMLTSISKLKELFNRYVQLTGCTGHLGPVTLGENTPLLHLLSCPSEHNTDLLFTVIKDVITFLNQFFEAQLRVLKECGVNESLLPSSRRRVPVMEFVHHYMLIAQARSCNDLLQLIHGRTLLPPAYPPTSDAEPRRTHSYLPGQLSTLIDLHPLQDDILSLCVVGVPLIDPSSIDSLRLPFKFKEDTTSNTLQQLKLQDYASDLESIASKLPDAFKVPLDDTYRKRLEYEFHCAGYHTVMEVISGLRTAIGHLIQDVADDNRRGELVTVKLPEYLVSLYEYDPQNSATDVFHEIGINSLSQAQHACLDSLSLDNLFHTRNMFVRWAEEGLYDFCSLPFGVKKHLSESNEQALDQLPKRFNGSPAELLNSLRSLVDVLVHLEPSIVKAATSTPQKSLIDYLEKLKVCSNIEGVHDIIPANVCLENYVSLRLVMRRLITRVQRTRSQSELSTPEPIEEKWNEFISDLWEKRLQNFRRTGYNVRTFPASTSKAPETIDVTESYSTILNELIRFTSERNLLDAFAEDELNLSGSLLELPTTEEAEESITAPLKQPAISDEELLRLAKKVSVEQVVEFLQSVQLDQYATTFEESDISGELLMEFQDAELEEMEIDSPLDRLKIVVFFKRFLMESEGVQQEDIVSPSEVAKVLNEYRQLKEYAKAFLENRMDSDLIGSASDEVFRELGVEKGAHRLMIRSKFNANIN